MVVHDVVVNEHVSRCTVGVVQVVVSLDVVSFASGRDVDELETVVPSNPEKVGSNVSDQPGDVVVAAVQNAVVFGEGHEPPVGGDVVPQHAQAFGANVGDVAHDFHDGVPGLGALAPVLFLNNVEI